MTGASGEGGSRRGQLLGAKLLALVGDHLGRALDGVSHGFEGGAAMLVDQHAWVLIDGDAERSLGRALAWATRHDAISMDIIAENNTGLLARRAERFAYPVTVWCAVGRLLLPAVASPLPIPTPPSSHHLVLREVIEGAGAHLVVEHGVVTGEARGLEVCRVVDAATSGYFDEPDGGESVSAMTGVALAGVEGLAHGKPRVEVGVGGPDREAFRIIHGDVPTIDALADVVATVERHRSIESPAHPLKRLVPERFLRWRVERNPGLIGFRTVEATEPPLPRRGLNEVTPCAALGADIAGRQHAVVCTVGVDLDLIPFVADVLAQWKLPVVVVLPARDLLPITVELAELLADPIQFVTVD